MSLGDDFNSAAQHPAVAGVVGSLLSLKWVPGDSWKEKAFSFGCGMGVVLFLVPAGLAYLEIKTAWAPPAFGFMGGLVGMNLIGKFVEFVRNTDWLGLVDFFRGRKQ